MGVLVGVITVFLLLVIAGGVGVVIFTVLKKQSDRVQVQQLQDVVTRRQHQDVVTRRQHHKQQVPQTEITRNRKVR